MKVQREVAEGRIQEARVYSVMLSQLLFAAERPEDQPGL
jgi:hypothetical protein